MGQFYNYLIFFFLRKAGAKSEQTWEKRGGEDIKKLLEIFLLYSSLVSWPEKHSVFCYFKKCRQCQIIFTPKNNVELELTEEEEKEEEEEGKEEGDDGEESLDVSCNLSPVEGTKKHFC